MRRQNVEKYINEVKDTKNGVFMGLIDPDPMKQTPEKSLDLAKKLYEGGADLVLLGGSIGAQGAVLDRTAKLIKENIDIPVHLFPGNTGTVTKYADSIYFMSLLNSSNPYWIMGAPLLAAPVIKKYGLEPIPTAYLVFEPGQTVGWVGESRLLPRNKPDLAVVYAMAAEYMGMRFAILESGSGAPEPVPSKIVSAVRHYTDLNIVIAGGVKTPRQAYKLIKSGASCIHIGTKIEDAKDPEKRIKEFEQAIHMKKKYW